MGFDLEMWEIDPSKLDPFPGAYIDPDRDFSKMPERAAFGLKERYARGASPCTDLEAIKPYQKRPLSVATNHEKRTTDTICEEGGCMNPDRDHDKDFCPFPFWAMDLETWYPYVDALKG